MTTLAELQRVFGKAMFGDQSSLAAASELVQSSNRQSGVDHVRIYRQTVLGTLTASLANVFPVTRRLVGPEFFDAMAGRYIPFAPSYSPDLADYGYEFSDFIKKFAPAAELPYLADVALLEWYWHRAFHAADEPGLSGTELSRAAEHEPERITFRLPVSASLLESEYPIRQIWEANQAEEDGDGSISLDAGGNRVIVWRPSATELRIDEVLTEAWHLLQRVREGCSLEQLSETKNISQVLLHCAQRGWLGSFEVASTN